MLDNLLSQPLACAPYVNKLLGEIFQRVLLGHRHLAVASCPLGYPPAEPLLDLQQPSDFLLRFGRRPRYVLAKHQRHVRPHGAPETRGINATAVGRKFQRDPTRSGLVGAWEPEYPCRGVFTGVPRRSLVQGTCKGIPAGAATEIAGPESPQHGLHRPQERWTSFPSRRCNARQPFNNHRNLTPGGNIVRAGSLTEGSRAFVHHSAATLLSQRRSSSGRWRVSTRCW